MDNKSLVLSTCEKFFPKGSTLPDIISTYFLPLGNSCACLFARSTMVGTPDAEFCHEIRASISLAEQYAKCVDWCPLNCPRGRLFNSILLLPWCNTHSDKTFPALTLRNFWHFGAKHGCFNESFCDYATGTCTFPENELLVGLKRRSTRTHISASKRLFVSCLRDDSSGFWCFNNQVRILCFLFM